MLKERYISSGNTKAGDARRADFSEYTLSQIQDMLREALMGLQRAMLSMEVRALVYFLFACQYAEPGGCRRRRRSLLVLQQT